MHTGHVEVTRLLISNGAIVNEKDNNGKTAFMFSACGCNEMNTFCD